MNWLDELSWNEQGLVPAITQEQSSGEVLMVAWMNRDALLETLETSRAVYYSRSRQRLWRKGEESGNTQTVHEVRIDCDADVVLLQVTQTGGVACHTGRRGCFYRVYNEGRWQITDDVLVDPATLYKKL